MIDFAPGMRTIIRDEEWMVKKIETNSLGNKTLYCVGISPLVKDREAIFLTDLEEIQIVDPAEVKLVADTSPFYKRALLYLESQWRQQIPTDANLHIGHKAAMDLMPYQLDPAKLALQRPRQRILIADTVGLGKTLEAGILMSELIARGKGKRILVVTVKSMMTQFQKEMWNRFTIPLVRLDSNRIQKIRANLPSNYNPFFYYDKTIVSIDTLKRDVEYRTHLENAYWDIIVIDEAQNVAERGDHQAQRSRLAKLLADRSDTMIMLSATPHDGRAKSFASLMNMLDPTAIADPQNYTPEDIKGLCIRRFKKDVKDQVSGSFLERKITLERCNASAKEEYAFDIFAEMQLEMDLGKTKGTGQLFKTSLEKSLFSSPAACIKSIEARLKKLYKKYTADDIKDIHLLENLKTALEAITPADFTRYQKLLDLIRSKEYAWNPADSGDRVVIFTERIETMKYLAERLRKDLGLKANAIQEISGGMSDAEQQRIVEDFGRTESPVRVLVASDVASEGLNLHYLSHRLIHFDIPWSLMVFQQRNGRIDRYGQQNRPDIRYMLIESDNKRIKGDMRIIEILITKEEQALKNIGDPSLLLGKFTIEDEELVVAETIESGSDSDAFEQTLDAGEDDFDPFEALMAAAGKEEDEDEKKSEIVSDETLFSDMDYLYQALTYLNQTENHSVERLKTVSGLDIRLTPDMERRLKALVPEEALPQGETLRVSDDNHYFSTVFEENTRATISGWNAAARESEEIKTPWSLLRQNARQYYTAHDKFVRSSVNLQVLANIKALVGNYLKSLGYPEAKPEVVAVDDSLSVPVYLEMTKSNGAPLLWVLLSASKESDAGIMESFVFNANDVDDDAAGTLYKGVLGEIANEDLVTKILFGTAEPPRFVMLIGMNQIALIDRNKWNEKRYLQFELEEIFSRLENTTLQAMSVLLHKDSLCPDDGKVLLDELDEQSQKNASGVSQDLKYALRESIELLGNEVLYDMKARLGRDLDADPVDAGQLTLECLRYMYRMLFVLFIESRPELGYAPIKAQSYYSGYSLESLRDIADNIRDDVNEVGDGYYLHETLAKLYELIYDGYPKTEDELKKATGSDSLHDMFLIAPLKAHIFDPEYTKMITAAKLRNSCMLRIIDLMSLTRATGRKNGRRGRISYVNLGINQMGAVYEALLSYRGFIAEHDLYEVKRAGDSFNELDVGYFVSESELEQYTEDERVRYESGEKAGKLRMYEKGTFIYRLAGREREKSASYYTPEVLTKCLVKHALKELLEGKTADEILKLTICEIKTRYLIQNTAA